MSLDYGYFAFCKALESITLGASAPTLLGSNIFLNATPPNRIITIYVPTGATGYDTAWQTQFLDGTSGITLAIMEQ
jgi:hypothetical protein